MATLEATRNTDQLPSTEDVLDYYNFPFKLRPYQTERTDLALQWAEDGKYWDPGTGKTAGSTHCMLYWVQFHGIKQWIVLMPPILIPQWARWLRSITDKSGRPLTVTEYAGTPAQRKKMQLDTQFILMSYQIFKGDWDRICLELDRKTTGLTLDEAHAIKNYKSDNHKAVHMFAEGKPLSLLTGTPITSPIDAFGYCRLITPGTYRNLRDFERQHIGAMDEWQKVVEWVNLDKLASNMRIKTTRLIAQEVRDDMPSVTFTPIHYNLDKAHQKLYDRVAEEKLVELENGGEISALNASALQSALQQIVLNWGEFAEEPDLEPAALALIDTVMDEIGAEKLVVAAHFRRSNAYLLEKLGRKYGAVAVYGEVSPKGKQEAISRFINDTNCKIIIAQPSSAGFGVDGLQHVCHNMLILEAPTTAPPFHQVVKRLDRDGQKHPVMCRVAVALGTVQVRMFKKLLENDAQVNSIQGGFKDLRDAIYGK